MDHVGVTSTECTRETARAVFTGLQFYAPVRLRRSWCSTSGSLHSCTCMLHGMDCAATAGNENATLVHRVLACCTGWAVLPLPTMRMRLCCIKSKQQYWRMSDVS